MATRIKICGITRGQDAVVAAELGAHAVGLMFYEDSPRFVSLDKAREVIEVLPDRKSTRLNSSHIQKSRMPSSA